MVCRSYNFQKIIILPLLLAGFFSIAPSARADTATINAALGDGYVRSDPGVCSQAGWSALRNAASGGGRSFGSVELNPAVWAEQCANGTSLIRRAFFPFDTSALPDGAVITAATLNIYVPVPGVTNTLNDGNDFLSVVKSNQASLSMLLTSEYQPAGFTEGSSRIDISSISANSWVSLPLNAAGRSWISTTGNTMLAVLEGHDILDIYNLAVGQNSVGMRTSNYGGAYVPYLQVTYNAPLPPDIIPPTPPTTVSLGSATPNSLTASWSGAGDNVAVTGYRLDVSTSAAFGSFVSGYNNLNVGNVTSQIISGLNPSTTYYTRVRAYDAAGNISSNSATANGTTLAPPPPPNVSGYAWAGSGEGANNAAINENPGIGWISLSCANAGNCVSTGNYGIRVSSASPGALSGYAWANPNDGAQNNIGWISFNRSDVGNPPFDDPGGGSGPIAVLNRTTGAIRGWARALGYQDAQAGGWDGWIRLWRDSDGDNIVNTDTGAAASDYGARVSGCSWSGYAWGGGVNIGWIHFGGIGYPITGSGDACAVVAPQCSDGVDNDGDGFIDFPADLGCIDGNDDDETGGVPAAPSGLTVNAGSGAACNAMAVTWTDNSTPPNNETRFELERKRSSELDTAYVEIAEPQVDSDAYTDTFDGVPLADWRNVSYTYRIRACNLFGCSGYSNTDTATNQNPLPSFTWSPPSPIKNTNASFNASASQTYGASVREYFWTFTDGTPAAFCSSVGGGCNPPLTPLASTQFGLPPAPAQKPVTLRVTDSAGAGRQCSITQSVPVSSGAALPSWIEVAPQ